MVVVGFAVAAAVGDTVEGIAVGMTVGTFVGVSVGVEVAATVGVGVEGGAGWGDGFVVGVDVGRYDGVEVGVIVGDDDGVGVGFDVVGGCEREGGSECFCERIDTPRHNTIIFNKILTPGRYDGVEVGVIVGDDDGVGVGFDVVGGCEREGGSECFCERIDSPRHNKIEHGYNQQNTYSRIGHIGACPA